VLPIVVVVWGAVAAQRARRSRPITLALAASLVLAALFVTLAIAFARTPCGCMG
jgi:hypothetical protein